MSRRSPLSTPSRTSVDRQPGDGLEPDRAVHLAKVVGARPRQRRSACSAGVTQQQNWTLTVRRTMRQHGSSVALPERLTEQPDQCGLARLRRPRQVRAPAGRISDHPDQQRRRNQRLALRDDRRDRCGWDATGADAVDLPAPAGDVRTAATAGALCRRPTGMGSADRW